MSVPVITGTLQESYEVLDSVFAFAQEKPEGFFNNTIDMNKAFDNVKDKLRVAARAIGGNAVINCQFEYRIAIDRGLNTKQVLELFAYGTAVLSSKTYITEEKPLFHNPEEIYQLKYDHQGCIQCPVCGTRFMLDSNEVKSNYFECTECKNGIKFKTT